MSVSGSSGAVAKRISKAMGYPSSERPAKCSVHFAGAMESTAKA